MKTGWIVFASLALVASLAAAELGPNSFAVDVTINQVRNMFDCRATLTDLSSGQVLFKPRVTARQGETTKAETEGSLGGLSYRGVLTVFSDGSKTSYTIELLRGGTVVFRSAATIGGVK